MPKAPDMTSRRSYKAHHCHCTAAEVINFGQQLYMVTDTAIVGHGVGFDGLALVDTTDLICWLVLWAPKKRFFGG